MFDRDQVQALAGPLKDIQRLVPKLLLRCLGCLLRVVVLLGGDPKLSDWGGVLWSRISLYFAPFIFPSILTCLPVPATDKHPHSMTLPPTCITVGMVSGFLQMWHLAFRPKSSIFVSSDKRIFRCSVRVTIRFIVTSMTNALLPTISQAGRAASSNQTSVDLNMKYLQANSAVQEELRKYLPNKLK